MVPRGGKGRRDPGKNALAGMDNAAGLSMDRNQHPGYPPTERLDNGLVPKADPENRDAPGILPDHVTADPGLIRRSRAGREDNPFRVLVPHLLKRCITGDRERHTPQLADQLVEVIGKAVIAVDDSHPHGPPPLSPTALTIARAFCTVSSNSRSGIESATIPAPVEHSARPPFTRTVLMAMANSSRSSNPQYPTAPAYNPLGDASRSAMICIARIFGAPLTVPAGKQEARASNR